MTTPAVRPGVYHLGGGRLVRVDHTPDGPQVWQWVDTDAPRLRHGALVRVVGPARDRILAHLGGAS